MALREKYLVYENIHSTKKDLSHLEWVKAPYRYRYIQRFLGILMLCISVLVMTFSGFLLFFALGETPTTRYSELLQNRMTLYIREILRNSLRYRETEESSAYLKKLSSLKAELGDGSKAAEYAETLAALSLLLDQKRAEALHPPLLFKEDQATSNPLPSTLGSPLIQDANQYKALSFYFKRLNKNISQIEHIKGFEGIETSPSNLVDVFDFPYPFTLLLHYTRVDNPTLDAPYVDLHAPYQLVTSDKELQIKIFNESIGVDVSSLQSQFNVIVNLKAGWMRVDNKYYNLSESFDEAYLPYLTSYFSSDLQKAILQNPDLKVRVPNLIIGLKIKPEEIYALDSRPVYDKNIWSAPWVLLSENYNAIARAEQINAFVPILTILLIGSLAFYILFFSRLCSYAGYISNRHGEIPKNAMPSALFKLMWLDYVPLEIGMAFYLWVYSILLLPFNEPSNLAYIIPGFFLLNSVALLSIIRRYRGKVLYKHSLVYYLAQLFTHIQRYWRFSLGYFILFIVGAVFAYRNYFWGSLFVLVLVFILSLRYLSTLEVVRQRLRRILQKNEEKKVTDTDYMNTLQENIEELENLLSSSLSSQLKNEKLKTELITNVSHDLRTPLTSIVNYTSLLKKGDASPEEAKDYIDRIYHNSVRLQTLTEDLLAASKAASGTLETEPVVLDLNDFLKQVCGEWVDRFAEKNISLNYRIFDTKGNFCLLKFTEEGEEGHCHTETEMQSPQVMLMDSPLMVEVDPNHLVRIFENLLGNCLKYSIPGSRVFLNVREQKNKENMSEDAVLVPVLSEEGQEEQESHILLEIVNTSNQHLDLPTDQLMERFVQGDRSRRSEGSGLGLAIVKSLTELLNVEFNIRLEEDRFKVSLRFPKHLSL